MATRSASTTGIHPGTAGRRARTDGGEAGHAIDVRVPPHNITAEASLLGAMFLSRDAIADAIEIVRPEHFYKPAHAHIFDAIVTLYGAGEPVDPVTVAEVLDRAALLESLGGAGIIVDLQPSTPAIASVSRYARIVQEHATLRRLIGVAHDIADIAYAKPDDVVKAVDQAESLEYEVGQGRVADTMAQIRDLLDANLPPLEPLSDRD